MLHLRKFHIHKGILFANKPFQHSLYASFSIQRQAQHPPPKKEFQLSDEPPTPWPPINPKLDDYEAQKGPQKQKQTESSNRTLNVTGAFLFAGFLCGAIISYHQPKDCRNDFSFYSPLPDAYYTKFEKVGDLPETFTQTSKNIDEYQQDYANALTYTMCLGFSSGLAGSMWYRLWTHPLRVSKSTVFEISEAIKELRANWVRNWFKGTLIGSACVLGVIYTSVFFSYLFLGQFYGNKYVDTHFWEYIELLYKRNREGMKEYEFTVELQERLSEKHSIYNPPIAPSFSARTVDDEGKVDMVQDENYQEINERLEKEAKKREIRRKSYTNTYKANEWDTKLYSNTKDISYYKLDENAKLVRWNVAREMAMLACSCTVYIVVPVFLGANFIATRVYSNYWKRLMQDMIRTKEAPLITY